jgi:hypothetical protein
LRGRDGGKCRCDGHQNRRQKSGDENGKRH